MDENTFWSLIERAKSKSDGDSETQVELLQQMLEQLPPDEIISFERLYQEMRGRAYRNELWAAAYLINGGCSDDGFEFFRGWLIAQGRKTYENAIADPDSLADVPEVVPDVELESMLYVAMAAYEVRTGQKMETVSVDGMFDLKGKPWQEDDLCDLLPRLAQKFS